MTYANAVRLLARRLREATPEQFQDVRDILLLGAGDTWSTRTDVAWQHPLGERGGVCVALVDGLRHLGGIDERGQYRPSYAGNWEPVLATMIIEGQWEKVREIAEELRKDREG